jgi:hypothetical protein
MVKRAALAFVLRATERRLDFKRFASYFLLMSISRYLGVLLAMVFPFVSASGADEKATELQQLVQPLPGQIVASLPGQLIQSLPGQLVHSLPVQIAQSLPGQLVRSLPGQLVQSFAKQKLIR